MSSSTEGLSYLVLEWSEIALQMADSGRRPLSKALADEEHNSVACLL